MHSLANHNRFLLATLTLFLFELHVLEGLTCNTTATSNFRILNEPTTLSMCEYFTPGNYFCSKRQFFFEYDAVINISGKEYYLGRQNLHYTASGCSLNDSSNKQNSCREILCKRDLYYYLFVKIVSTTAASQPFIRNFTLVSCQAACCYDDYCNIDLKLLDSTSTATPVTTSIASSIMALFLSVLTNSAYHF